MPFAIDKKGYTHSLIEEGYGPAILGRGEDYEEIVRREGKPRRVLSS